MIEIIAKYFAAYYFISEYFAIKYFVTNLFLIIFFQSFNQNHDQCQVTENLINLEKVSGIPAKQYVQKRLIDIKECTKPDCCHKMFRVDEIFQATHQKDPNGNPFLFDYSKPNDQPSNKVANLNNYVRNHLKETHGVDLAEDEDIDKFVFFKYRNNTRKKKKGKTNK